MIRNGRSKGGLAVVDVAIMPDVYVRLIALKLLMAISQSSLYSLIALSWLSFR